MQIGHQDPNMLGIGAVFPEFRVEAVIPGDTNQGYATVDRESYPGRWKLYFFWPMDFTYVCPTEIVGFGRLNNEFLDRDCQLLGCSVDSQYVHMAWRNDHEDLQDLPLPMLSDVRRELCGTLGILDPQTGVAQRATFIVDPENIIRHVSVNDINVGRNPLEALRILDALQTNELCPCNWNRGERTLDR